MFCPAKVPVYQLKQRGNDFSPNIKPYQTAFIFHTTSHVVHGFFHQKYNRHNSSACQSFR